MEADKAIVEEVIKALEGKYKKELEVVQKLLSIPNLDHILGTM
jgi:hypothetical protein